MPVPELNLYVEKSSSRIFEGKLFEDFIIVRPILAVFHNQARKMDPRDFLEEFEDFEGDRNEIRTFLTGKYEPSEETVQ